MDVFSVFCDSKEYRLSCRLRPVATSETNEDDGRVGIGLELLRFFGQFVVNVSLKVVSNCIKTYIGVLSRMNVASQDTQAKYSVISW